MRVIIMSGIPGSGKSTYAKTFPEALICSADDFFVENGVYRFDRTKLGEAHKACLKRFFTALRIPGGWEYVVVDNTNIHPVDISPYYRLAEAWGFSTKIVTLRCAAETAFKRNKHGVPLDTIKRMESSLSRRNLPREWIEEVVC